MIESEHERDLIAAIRLYGDAVVSATKTQDFGGAVKGDIKRERSAATQLLSKVLGRIPTDEIIDLVIPG